MIKRTSESTTTDDKKTVRPNNPRKKKGFGYALNKAQLVRILAENNDLNIKHSQEIVTDLFNIISHSLRHGPVGIAGFGIFTASFVPEQYDVINPRDPQGERITRAAYHTITFRISEALRKLFREPMTDPLHVPTPLFKKYTAGVHNGLKPKKSNKKKRPTKQY